MGLSTRRAGTRRFGRGFTLIELMIVLVILGVLCLLMLVAIRRNIMAARRASVISNMANLALKESAALTARGHYISTTNSESELFPVALDELSDDPQSWTEIIDSEDYTREDIVDPEAQFFIGGGSEHGFDALNFMPINARSYCAYGVISGIGSSRDANEIPDQPLGIDEFDLGRYTSTDWYYIVVRCDLDEDGRTWDHTLPSYRSTAVATVDGVQHPDPE